MASTTLLRMLVATTALPESVADCCSFPSFCSEMSWHCLKLDPVFINAKSTASIHSHLNYLCFLNGSDPRNSSIAPPGTDSTKRDETLTMQVSSHSEREKNNCFFFLFVAPRSNTCSPDLAPDHEPKTTHTHTHTFDKYTRIQALYDATCPCMLAHVYISFNLGRSAYRSF